MSANGSVSGAAPSGSRSRPQARKKPNDDAAYFGPPAASKRQAVDRAEGEPRVKRKRVEPRKVDRRGVSADADEDKSSVCFLLTQGCDLGAYRPIQAFAHLVVSRSTSKAYP